MEGRADISGGEGRNLWRGGLIFLEGRTHISGGRADISGGQN